jgi:hypothetical protein
MKKMILFLLLIAAITVQAQDVRHDQLRSIATEPTDTVILYKTVNGRWYFTKALLDTSLIAGLADYVTVRVPTKLINFDSTGFTIDTTQVRGLLEYIVNNSDSGQWVNDANGITYTTGNVGIGTESNANAKIATNGAVLFGGTFGSGSIPVEGSGTRMMWYPAKAAFRVGRVISTEWNDANIGNYSTSIGNRTTASGTSSTSIGVSTIASGLGAIAFGGNTTASGSYSLSSGNQTSALSAFETAIGQWNTSYTPASATGWNTADRLFVIGNGTGSTATSNALVMLKSGKTGFGKDIPAYTVDVNGDINTDSIYRKNGLPLKLTDLDTTGFQSGIVYPSAGIPVSTGTAWGTSKTAPSGVIVGTTDTQTLSAKTLTNPIISGAATNTDGALGISSNVMAFGTGSAYKVLVTRNEVETLTRKTLTTPILTNTDAGIAAGQYSYHDGFIEYGDGANQRIVVNTDQSQALTNKSVNGVTLSTSAGTANFLAGDGTYKSVSGSMTYPSGSGIPVVSGGTSWGTTITNSSGLAGAISDETGTGALVFGTSPSITTGLTLNFATANQLLATDASKNVVSLSTSTYPSLTELSYMKGVTSSVQTQFNNLGSMSTKNFWTGTQAQYNALGTYSSSTIYFIEQ